MADYIVTGQRGAGKSLIMCQRIITSVRAGNRIATNLDLYLEYLLPLKIRNSEIIRLPDHPSGADIRALGFGGASPLEGHFGDLILDELAIWLNARDWQDDKRRDLLNFLVLSRKSRWNTFLITQLLTSLDKQARGLLEHHISCGRTDRIRIPVIGWIIHLFGKLFHLKSGYLPLVHIGHITYGTGPGSIGAGQIVCRGLALYKAYNTEQKFGDAYPFGSYCYLQPRHLIDTLGWSQYLLDDFFCFAWEGRPESWPSSRPLLLLPVSSAATLASVLPIVHTIFLLLVFVCAYQFGALISYSIMYRF